jgi:hypothetical protein
VRSFFVRLVLSALGALAGSTIGFACYQWRIGRGSEDGGGDITIAAPGATAALATLIGLVGGRKGPVLAFVAGAGITAAVGMKVDESLQGLIGGQVPEASASDTNSLQSSG